jgi:hypothetical protein
MAIFDWIAKRKRISPDELSNVLAGDAGILACPFCGTDNRVSDLATPFGCARCSAMFGILPGEVPSDDVVGKLASRFASLPALGGLGRIEKVQAVPVEGLGRARQHFALCMIFKA